MDQKNEKKANDSTAGKRDRFAKFKAIGESIIYNKQGKTESQESNPEFKKIKGARAMDVEIGVQRPIIEEDSSNHDYLKRDPNSREFVEPMIKSTKKAPGLKKEKKKDIKLEGEKIVKEKKKRAASTKPKKLISSSNNSRRSQSLKSDIKSAFKAASEPSLNPYEIPSAVFRRFADSVVSKVAPTNDIRWSPEALDLLHLESENYLIEIFSKMETIVRKSKRKTLMPRDFAAFLEIKGFKAKFDTS